MKLNKIISNMTLAEGKKSIAKIGDVRELWARFFDLEEKAIVASSDGVMFDVGMYESLSPIAGIGGELEKRFGLNFMIQIVDKDKLQKVVRRGQRKTARKK